MERVLEAVARERAEVEELERRLASRRRRLVLIEALASEEVGWEEIEHRLSMSLPVVDEQRALDPPEPDPEPEPEPTTAYEHFASAAGLDDLLDPEPENPPLPEAVPTPPGPPALPADDPSSGPERPGEELRNGHGPLPPALRSTPPLVRRTQKEIDREFEDRRERVRSIVALYEPCPRRTLVAESGLGTGALKRTLDELRDRGVVQLVGDRGGGRYWLTSTLDAATAATSGGTNGRRQPGITERVREYLFENDATEQEMSAALDEDREFIAIATSTLLDEGTAWLRPDGRYTTAPGKGY